MTKYKYSRKRIVKKLSYYMNVKFPYKLIDDLLATTTKSSKEKEFIPQNGEEFWFKKKSPTPSTNIKEIDTINFGEDYLKMHPKCITDRLNEVINSLNTIIKK